MFFGRRFVPISVSDASSSHRILNLQTAREGVQVAAGAVVPALNRERSWHRRDGVSACVAVIFLIRTIAIANDSATARPPAADAPAMPSAKPSAMPSAKPSAKPPGWPSRRTRTSSATRCMWKGSKPGASRTPDIAAASRAKPVADLSYKMR